MYLFFGIVILAALLALYFMLGQGGKGGIDVSLKEGTFKFNVDKPLVEQAKIETKTYKSSDGRSIDYTTGTVDKNVLTSFNNENVTFTPNYFVGENLISEAAGYILSSAYPEMWSVQYNALGLNDPFAYIHYLMAPDGSNLNVMRAELMYDNIRDFVESSVNYMVEVGGISQYPDISYADDGRTAFLTFTNPTNNGQSYMKVVKEKAHYYTVTANYNLEYSDYLTQQELIRMVANFTLIE